MNNSKMLRVAMTYVLGAALAACSSSSSGGGTPDGGGSDGGGTDAPKTDTAGGSDAPKTDTGGGGSDAPKTDSGGGGDDVCGAMASNAECQQCCGATNHPDAYNAFATALLGCACKAGNCDTQCAGTACPTLTATPTAACTKCLNDIQSGACKADLDKCATAACADFVNCAQTQCAGKT